MHGVVVMQKYVVLYFVLLVFQHGRMAIWLNSGGKIINQSINQSINHTSETGTIYPIMLSPNHATNYLAIALGVDTHT